MNLFNDMVAWFIRRRIEQIDHTRNHPVQAQEETFRYLLDMGRNTEFGRKHGFDSIKNANDYGNRFPVQDYDMLKPYIERVMQGEQYLLWPTKINWFAKSSGTTSDKSKYIPVSREALDDCHYKGGKDVLAIYCNNYPDTKVFTGKSLVMGGSNKVSQVNPDSYSGDVSAVMLQNLPFIAEFFRTPELSIALMGEWEEKIEKMARSTMLENVTHIAGAPTWTLVLIRRILELSGKKHILEVWPHLELFIHGGVSFNPYRNQYQEVIPGSTMRYLETYNASEGFIALQDDLSRNDMLLMLDYGIFYEFIPMENWQDEQPKTVLLDEVEVGKQYALVMTTNTGLWRYKIGDTVRFTSKYPFRIEISGRVKHFINVFGEELMVDNTDKALADACSQTGATVKEYSAAPIFLEGARGYHQWLIEFEKAPDDMAQFAALLDAAVQNHNSDYEAKRYKSMVLEPLRITPMPHGSFHNWLKSKGKLGGQHKIPRLFNDDRYLKEILEVGER